MSPVHQKPGPGPYGFMIAPSAAEVAAVTAVTTTAYRFQGYLDISFTAFWPRPADRWLSQLLLSWESYRMR